MYRAPLAARPRLSKMTASNVVHSSRLWSIASLLFVTSTFFNGAGSRRLMGSSGYFLAAKRGVFQHWNIWGDTFNNWLGIKWILFICARPEKVNSQHLKHSQNAASKIRWGEETRITYSLANLSIGSNLLWMFSNDSYNRVKLDIRADQVKEAFTTSFEFFSC